MSKPPIVVAGETFATKKALEERCRKILYSYKPTEWVDQLDLYFITHLLARHPDVHEKVGVGIAAIFVEAEFRGTQHFSILRVDGTTIDFSFKSCITAKTPERDLRAACRTAVVESVQKFKAWAFDANASLVFQCPITGEPVTKATAHVDHAPPWTFEEIVRAFVESYGSPAVSPDGGVVTSFTKPEDATAFRVFHDARARLRIVSKKANLSVLRRAPKDGNE